MAAEILVENLLMVAGEFANSKNAVLIIWHASPNKKGNEAPKRPKASTANADRDTEECQSLIRHSAGWVAQGALLYIYLSRALGSMVNSHRTPQKP